MMNRKNISSGGPWEDSVGYSRAVRVGQFVHVAGTTAMTSDGMTGVGDAGAQARQAFDTIEQALRDAGASMGDVVRTRMYVTSRRHADAVLHAHGERFRDIRPAATIVVVSALLHEHMLVEIEADAQVE